MNKPVLIVEHCMSGLQCKIDEKNAVVEKQEYILSGPFTEFNVKNRNDRIYTADKFLPHLNELMSRKETLGVVYGEFDHPDVFDTSLARVSHTIESMSYNQEKNRVDGSIRLLNTHWGKEAKALVEDKLPIFVSSRAAGITESDNTVSIKKLFTYDCVADPGFSSARMEVKNLNESLGFANESTNFRIYDMSEDTKTNEFFEMNEKDFVTRNELTEYSEYLAVQLTEIKEYLNENSNGSEDVAKYGKMAELYENVQTQHSKVKEYLDYLGDKLTIIVEENEANKERTDKLIKHNNYLAENLEKSINYSGYLAEKLDKSINYGEYIAETLDKNISFSEYIAEHVDKNIKYSDYLAENLEKTIDYSEYIAENLDNNIAYGEYLAENIDNSIVYSEYLAENLDNNIAYAEYLAENVDNNIAYAEYIAEHVDNSIAYSEYIAENVSDTQAYSNYIAESLDKTIEAIKGNKINENEKTVVFEDFKPENVDTYYEDGAPAAQPAVQTPVAEPGAEVQVEAEAGADVNIEAEAGADVQVEVQGDEAQPAQTEVQDGAVVEEPLDGVEGEPVEAIQGADLTNAVVSVNIEGVDKTGEIKAFNDETNLYVIELSDVVEAQPGVEAPIVEAKREDITILSDKLLENENSIKDYVAELLKETKNLKNAKQAEPHFFAFLTEKSKKIYHDLSAEDKEKVDVALTENTYYSEPEVLSIMSKTLNPSKSFEEILLENMPSHLKPTWTSLNENVKKGIISKAKLFQGLNTPTKMEMFWESRKLENYSSLNETKTVLTQHQNIIQDDKLQDDQLENILEKLRNI